MIRILNALMIFWQLPWTEQISNPSFPIKSFDAALPLWCSDPHSCRSLLQSLFVTLSLSLCLARAGTGCVAIFLGANKFASCCSLTLLALVAPGEKCIISILKCLRLEWSSSILSSKHLPTNIQRNKFKYQEVAKQHRKLGKVSWEKNCCSFGFC